MKTKGRWLLVVILLLAAASFYTTKSANADETKITDVKVVPTSGFSQSYGIDGTYGPHLKKEEVGFVDIGDAKTLTVCGFNLDIQQRISTDDKLHDWYPARVTDGRLLSDLKPLSGCYALVPAKFLRFRSATDPASPDAAKERFGLVVTY
jgi:hypothetical protein